MQQRQNHWDNVVSPQLPVLLRDDASLKIARVAKSYSVEFSSEENANSFVNLCSGLDLTWHDPRDQKASIIRVRGDLPIDARARQRAASQVWQQTLDLLKKGGRPMGNYRLGVNGYQGLVHLSSSEDVFELYYIKGASESGFYHEPNLESFRFWHVADKDVLDLLASVAATAPAGH